jgi:hypothetical protein
MSGQLQATAVLPSGKDGEKGKFLNLARLEIPTPRLSSPQLVAIPTTLSRLLIFIRNAEKILMKTQGLHMFVITDN